MDYRFMPVSMCLCASLILGNAWAGPGHSHEHRHHGSHEHGVAELNLAVDGNTVIIEMTSPAANIVGFEHKPRNESQRKQVAQAIQHLKNAEQMFTFPSAAGCSVQDVEIESELASKDDHHGHSHRETIDESSHSEFNMSYHFTCQSIEKLTSVNVKIFSHFSGMEKIKAQIITPNTQGLRHLSSTQSEINL